MLEYVQMVEQYNIATTVIIAQVERMKADATKYADRPDANLTVAAIKKEVINNIVKYVNAVDDVIDAQEAAMAETKKLQVQYKKLFKDYKILLKYAESKGCDLSLLPYMNEKDYR